MRPCGRKEVMFAGRFRSKAGAKKRSRGLLCGADRARRVSPFCSWQSYGAVTADAALYRNLRENIPILDAAIGKLVRLTGGFSLDTGSDGLNAQLNRVVRDQCGRQPAGD